MPGSWPFFPSSTKKAKPAIALGELVEWEKSVLLGPGANPEGFLTLANPSSRPVPTLQTWRDVTFLGKSLRRNLVEKGKLVEFRQNGERRLAVTVKPEGKKDWIVTDERGQNHKLRPQRFDFVVDGGPYAPEDIGPFQAQVAPLLNPAGLEVAWELLVDDGEAIAVADLAEILFSQQTPECCYAAHGLLSEDKVFFKKKGDRYEPRPQSQVQEIQHQIQVEIQKEQEKTEFLQRVHQALEQDRVEWTDSDRTRLEAIEKVALNPDQTYKAGLDILELLNRPPNAEGAFSLLVELKWWHPHENLFLRRSSFTSSFSQKVLDVAHAHFENPPQDPDQAHRLDLTHLKVYTVDDESTTEIDDGLSVEYGDNGEIKLWIHIADPTRLLSPDDDLEQQARRRSTSLYLPTGMISMFPTELATGPMSLVQGQICCALSFAVTLDGEGAIAHYEIFPTLIKPTYRLTYDDVDEMLSLGLTTEKELTDLHQAAQLRQRWRHSQGAISIKMPEASIKVKNDDEITIEVLDSSASREMVAEMMILAGEVAGRYGETHKLPLPFRGQPQPELPDDDELLILPAGPVRACALRRCMPRSETSTTPNRHASLGLDTYSQVTSPIRRYTDLISHFQIKAHLRNEPVPFSEDELKEILFGVTTSSQEASWVERQTNRYWSLEYLRRNQETVWSGVVLRWLREDDNLGVILLEELGLELPHRFERQVYLGDRLNVQVTRADPHRDEIRFREIIESLNSSMEEFATDS